MELILIESLLPQDLLNYFELIDFKIINYFFHSIKKPPNFKIEI